MWSGDDEAALLSFLAGGLLYLTTFSFPAFHYMTPTLLPLVGLATFIFHRASQSSHGIRRRIARYVGLGAGLSYVTASLIALGIYVNIPRAPVETIRGTVWVDLETAKLWNDILDYARTELSQHDQLFAVPYFPLFHFLSGRDHPTRFVALGPGLPGTEAEDEIIHQLESKGVEFVLNSVGNEYPGLESFESSYPRLHHYLTTRFEVEREFAGPFGLYAQVLRRAE